MKNEILSMFQRLNHGVAFKSKIPVQAFTLILKIEQRPILDNENSLSSVYFLNFIKSYTSCNKKCIVSLLNQFEQNFFRSNVFYSSDFFDL